jgi:hypothetical protein
MRVTWLRHRPQSVPPKRIAVPSDNSSSGTRRDRPWRCISLTRSAAVPGPRPTIKTRAEGLSPLRYDRNRGWGRPEPITLCGLICLTPVNSDGKVAYRHPCSRSVHQNHPTGNHRRRSATGIITVASSPGSTGNSENRENGQIRQVFGRALTVVRRDKTSMRATRTPDHENG